MVDASKEAEFVTKCVPLEKLRQRPPPPLNLADCRPHALRPVDDALVCNFLIACYRCRYTPRGLLQAYSECLLRRLSVADHAVELTEGGSEFELARRSLDESAGQAGPSAAALSSDDEGGAARAIPGRPGRLSPDASSAAAAALALGLHRCRDHALFKLLERAAIQRRSSGEGAMTPAQISSECGLCRH